MKTKEEWQNEFGKFPVDQKLEREIYSLAKLPESILPKVAFWNSLVTELDIEKIQLDAFKAGMTESVNVKFDVPLWCCDSLAAKECLRLYREAILNACDNKKEI